MIRIITGDCRDVLPTLPAESVHCVVTSPPYWGLRDYGVDGQLGLEETPEEYVDHLVAIFREVRRVLRDDGVFFLNLGDSYATSQAGNTTLGNGVGSNRHYEDGGIELPKRHIPSGLKPKDLCGIPWRVAFALQADGWWLRSDIIWHKPNCMPESVTDRPTKSHEYVFLLSKSARYFYDLEAIREDPAPHNKAAQGKPQWFPKAGPNRIHGTKEQNITQYDRVCGRNRRTVWTIPTTPYKEAHFATFPPALVEPCIKAGTSERGCCPECGAAWERVVEKEPSDWTERKEAGAIGGSLEQGHNTTHGKGTNHTLGRRQVIATSWQPTCNCYGGNQDGTYTRLGSSREMGRNNRPIQMQDMREDSKERGFSRGLQPIPCTVLDPFGGAGTVGLVADRLGRDAILIELSPEYAEMARQRIVGDAPMLVDVRMEQPPESRSRETL